MALLMSKEESGQLWKRKKEKKNSEFNADSIFPLPGSPLFLVAAVEELRNFAVYEKMTSFLRDDLPRAFCFVVLNLKLCCLLWVHGGCVCVCFFLTTYFICYVCVLSFPPPEQISLLQTLSSACSSTFWSALRRTTASSLLPSPSHWLHCHVQVSTSLSWSSCCMTRSGRSSRAPTSRACTRVWGCSFQPVCCVNDLSRLMFLFICLVVIFFFSFFCVFFFFAYQDCSNYRW